MGRLKLKGYEALALPTGEISIGDINNELETTGQRSLGQQDGRELAEKLTGRISLNDYKGKEATRNIMVAGYTTDSDIWDSYTYTGFAEGSYGRMDEPYFRKNTFKWVGVVNRTAAKAGNKRQFTLVAESTNRSQAECFQLVNEWHNKSLNIAGRSWTLIDINTLPDPSNDSEVSQYGKLHMSATETESVGSGNWSVFIWNTLAFVGRAVEGNWPNLVNGGTYEIDVT